MSVTRVFKNKEFYFVLIALIACLIHKLSFRIIMFVGYNLVGITPYIAAFLFVFVLCYEKRSFKTAVVEFLLGFAVLAAADWTVTRLLSVFIENLLWFALVYTPLHTALFSALIITAYAVVCGNQLLRVSCRVLPDNKRKTRRKAVCRRNKNAVRAFGRQRQPFLALSSRVFRRQVH